MNTDSSTPLDHCAVVLTPGRAYFGDGTTRDTSPGLHRTPHGILCGRLTKHATVVVDGATVADHEAGADQVRTLGWDYSRIGAWTLYRRGDRTVAVGLRNAMHPVHHLSVLFAADTDPGALAIILDRYNKLIGSSWRGTCATTALTAIRLTWANDRYQPLWRSGKKGPGYASGPIIWSRPLNEWETTWGWVHTFDQNAAYLAAMGNAELAWSELHHTGLREFSKKVPGYWHVKLGGGILGALGDRRRPPILSATRVRDGHAWITTPMADYLAQAGYDFLVVDSWTAESHSVNDRRAHPAGSRILRTFAEQMRDARTAVAGLPAGTLRDHLGYAVKRTYKDATGGMQRSTMRIARPDWAHTFIDAARAQLLRTADRVHATEGVWPCHIRTDSLSYADCSPTPGVLGDALGLGDQLGRWKQAQTVTTAEWLESAR